MNNSNINYICTNIIDIISTQNVRSEALVTFLKFMTSYGDDINMESQHHCIIYSTSPELQFIVLVFMIGLLAALK